MTGLFKEHYAEAVSYRSQNSRLCALRKSFPTSYLISSKTDLDEENKAKADCRADTVLVHSKVNSMGNADDLADVWTILSTHARLATTSPETGEKYEPPNETHSNVDFAKFEGCTYFSGAMKF